MTNLNRAQRRPHAARRRFLAVDSFGASRFGSYRLPDLAAPTYRVLEFLTFRQLAALRWRRT